MKKLLLLVGIILLTGCTTKNSENVEIGENWSGEVKKIGKYCDEDDFGETMHIYLYTCDGQEYIIVRSPSGIAIQKHVGF